MAQSNFIGKAQDYLDWFKLGYIQANKIYLPEVAPTPVNIVKAPSTQPSYKRCERGTSYVEQHLKDHIINYQTALEEEPALPRPKTDVRKVNMDDISTIFDSDHEDEDRDGDIGKGILTDRSHVYLHYDFSKYSDASKKLPVFNWKKDILKKVEEYPVVIIEGETGCGKSTQVPQFILDEAAENLKDVNIVVTQPRKIAATSLAHRVSQERGWAVGSLVAYQIGLDNQAGQDTRLSYVTTEVFVQKVIHKRSLDEFTHIILDEVHERDEHTDFALLLVKKLLHTVSRHVKVILMSATIDGSKFAMYFSTPVKSITVPAPIISVTDKTVHNVQHFYLGSLSVAYPNQKKPIVDDALIREEMMDLSVNLVRLFDDLERQEENIEAPRFPINRGAVLIFLPGLFEIEALIGKFKKEANIKKWVMYPLHSSLTLMELRSAFKPADYQERKIIFSTNIAESSITLTDIKYVIDFCLTKVITLDHLTNYTCLKMAWASKSSCKQRSGRVGRVSSGRVYRLVTKEFYEGLEPHPTPEICRSPLSQVILKAKSLSMGPPQALLALALDPPKLPDIYRTLLILKQIGCLSLKSAGQISSSDGDLTLLGRVASSLPLDPKLSKLIVMGFLFGCLYDTVIIAAGMSLKSFYSTPFQDELNAFLSKVSWAHGSYSDCLAILCTYKTWRAKTTMGEFARNNQNERKWARHSYVQLESLKEVHKLVEELLSRLKRLKLLDSDFIHNDSESAFFLKICLAGAFYPNYFKNNQMDDYERFICRELNGHDPFATLVVSGLPPHTNSLYDQQLKSLFKECARELNITYDSGRAYIHFAKRRRCLEMEETNAYDIPGDCPTSMYLALKMKKVHRIKNNLKLKVINPALAKQQVSSQSEGGILNAAKVVGTKNSLPSPNLPPPSVQVIKIRVTNVESPSRIWVAISDQENLERETYIGTVIEKKTDFIPLSNVVARAVCLAQYKETYEQVETYYRALIVEINPSQDRALVYFVDYGNSDMVDTRKLKEIPEELSDIPMLAIECSLCMIKPSSFNCDKNEKFLWSKDCINWFHQTILDREFMAEIYSVVHGVIRLHLFDYDSTNAYGVKKVSLNQSLIEKGFAVGCNEFYLSKHNHDLRKELGSLRNAQPSMMSSLSDSFPRCSIQDQNCPNIAISSAAISSVSFDIRGPSSPLEMSFVGLTRPASSLSIKLDRNSVNSTALDLEPQNQHDRLIVAPFVALTPSEKSLMCHQSTLMPTFPGMLGICLLMFCPYAELRLSEDGSEFIGAIFGLGVDPETGDSMYPDDDMEISFDFKFSHEIELTKVNELRFIMSTTLHSFDDMNRRDLTKQQNVMRELVKSLLKEDRAYKTPVYFRNSYRWNQIPLNQSRNPQVKGDDASSFLWQLLPSAVLTSRNMEHRIKTKTKELRNLRKNLKGEKLPGSYVINEECLLCQVPLRTFGHLENHFASKNHSVKEHQMYGFL